MVKNAAQKKAIRKEQAQKNVPYMEAKNRLEGKKEDYTAIVLVVDRSGSMASIATATQDALQEFINGQKELPGKFTVSSVFFDDQYEERAKLVDPKKEELDLSIHPRGMTALYDAVGKQINSFNEAVSKLQKKEQPTKVLFVIATDGMENASREYGQSTVAELIKQQQELHGWNFTFIGANQDAVLTAKGLNIAEDSAITFAANSLGTSNVIGAMSTYATALRSGGVASYSAADREAALEEE